MYKKITKLFFYLIIYSFFGYCLESIVAIVTMGVIESRQSFVYGPFCVIYGIGAIILIYFLSKYSNSSIKLFLFGMILGSSIEYFGSLIGEKILGFIWWDYSNMFLNINGRTSLFYSICWGLISIFLIRFIHPKINFLYEYLTQKINYFTPIIYSVFVLFLADAFISSLALNNFYNKSIKNYNIGTPIELSYLENFSQLYENTNIKEFIDSNFNNEKMIKTYPNILIPTISGEYLSMRLFINDVKPYYYKVFNK